MDMYQKRKMRQTEKNNRQEETTKRSNINCLPCIYTVHCLNPYKMGLFSK